MTRGDSISNDSGIDDVTVENKGGGHETYGRAKTDYAMSPGNMRSNATIVHQVGWLELARETLIRDIKGMFGTLMGEGDNNLLDHLLMVDDVERMGIHRYFEKEIKVAVEYVYRYWNKSRGISRGRKSAFIDLNSTALGLRILRLHRYHVSPATTTLQMKMGTSIAVMAVKYALDYPWRNSLPRLEARSFIDGYAGQSTATSSNEFRLKCLELAKLDFNMLQSSHQKEMQLVSRWWRESGLADLTFARHRHMEYYLWGAAVAQEPGFSTFRIALAKVTTLGTILEDIYDTYGTLDELKRFTEAVGRWDLSMMERLPEYIRVCFKVLYEAVNELASQAQNTQGREMLMYIRRAWEVYIGAYLQEAEWIAEEYVPTMEEYIENGINSVDLGVLTLHCILLLNQPLTDHILREIDMPSRFHRLVGLTL
eukprot:Gb_31103 [translate_table: standard]